MSRAMLSLALGSLLLAAFGVGHLAGKDAPSDVDGNWEMLTRGPQGDYTGDLVIHQDGEAIQGIVGTNFGDGPIQGKVKGTTIQFQATLAMQEGSIDVEYSGTVSGDRMKGTYEAADTKGSWSAVRQHSGR